MITAKITMRGVEEATVERSKETLVKVRLAAGDAAEDTFKELRSYTSQMRGPGRFNRSPFRPAHPGQWADDTRMLMNSYVADFQPLATGWEVVLDIADVINPKTGRNVRVYATILDQREGYFVLTGIDGPGAPWTRALALAAEKYGLEVTP